eukprot:CAMPEP_0176499560 /NCGR_PEP_ID=MMETSP0200_2-20121128/12997_1 /TAXON_ID=947934 /ORGANISM="Chaetoceros sp., Strain GSL56" /LENGTH=1200 /DNA_ID=CAMNT_0017897997 /DNA_START=264 /DNA_END=3866 /DNA_ORIENTATION=+
MMYSLHSSASFDFPATSGLTRNAAAVHSDNESFIQSTSSSSVEVRTTTETIVESAGPASASESLAEMKEMNSPPTKCLSPEKVPCTFESNCVDELLRSTYLNQLQEKIRQEYENKCRDLVVYGAALGSKYEAWTRSTEYLAERMIERPPGTCFLQFVTDTRNTGDVLSADGLQHLIVIDPARMPYINNRRNTKILKMNPGFLFPWADRVIWQDAKLLLKANQFGLPKDYLLHFNRTIERHHVCSSYVGLPLHRNAVGNSQKVNLKAHCKAVIAAANTRPTVSDDIDVLRRHCKLYEDMYKNSTLLSSEVFHHHHPFVDSAFIVYDMRSSVCRNFNSNFGHSWLKEIHCFSDRDQVSFPHVVASSKLRLSPEMQIKGMEFRDRIYIDKNDNPMIHIAKRSCHWYFRSFARCISPEQKEITDSREGLSNPQRSDSTSQLNVAVIVAGTLKRFMLDSTLRNAVGPMSDLGVSVDYFVSLTTAPAKAYRSSSVYIEHLQPDPLLPVPTLDDFVDVEESIRMRVARERAKVGALAITKEIDIDTEPMLVNRRKLTLKKHPNEDPDQRFPILDDRNDDTSQRTANANRNLLRLHFAIQNLWEAVTRREKEENFRYDYVMFLRDDTLWLDEFDINNVISTDADVIIPSCDARDPPLHESEFNDHILISRRDTADVFGEYYSKLFDTDVSACMEQLPDEISQDGKRGCNSEMLLKWIVGKENMRVSKLGQGLLPFQRSANVKLPGGLTIQCFHKFCQSKKDPMIITDDRLKRIEMCSKIEWQQIFEDFSWSKLPFDHLSWSNLPFHARSAAKTLGFGPVMWDQGNFLPSSFGKPLEDMSEFEINALRTLGYLTLKGKKEKNLSDGSKLQPEKLTQTRCSLNFFGLPRSFKSMALPSIVQNILKPNSIYHCDIVVHYYKIDFEDSGRYNSGGKIDTDAFSDFINIVNDLAKEAGQSTPSVIIVGETKEEFLMKYGEHVEQFQTAINPETGKLKYFPWANPTYKSLKQIENIVMQWNSIQTAWQLMEDHAVTIGSKYQRVAFFRSDAFYATPIDIFKVDKDTYDYNNEFAIIPGFARFPVNDRMMYGPTEAVRIWATQRFERLEHHIATYEFEGYGMHSERYMEHEILPAIQNETGHEVIENVDICFYRTRAGYSVLISDCSHPTGGTVRGMEDIDQVALVESIVHLKCIQNSTSDSFEELRCSNTSASI